MDFLKEIQMESEREGLMVLYLECPMEYQMEYVTDLDIVMVPKIHIPGKNNMFEDMHHEPFDHPSKSHNIYLLLGPVTLQSKHSLVRYHRL